MVQSRHRFLFSVEGKWPTPSYWQLLTTFIGIDLLIGGITGISALFPQEIRPRFRVTGT